MRVIARGTLTAFAKNRVRCAKRMLVQSQLDAWFAEVQRAAWKTPAELKNQFRSASIISGERVVFNIKGNEYRLLVAISYSAGIVLILWIGTHAEYDEIDVASQTYDKDRYLGRKER